MLKHVIVARHHGQMQRCYFLGYQDDGESFEARWTQDPWKACWIDAAEAVIEVELLTSLCPEYRLWSWSLDLIGTSNADRPDA
jgi:hypothetical protein